MAKIYLRGHAKPITIARATAIKISKQMEDDNILPQEYIAHPDFYTEKGNIKAVVINDEEDNVQEQAESRKNDNSEYYDRIDREHRECVLYLCDRSLSAKINDTRVYDLIWRACTGVEPTQEFREKIIERQREFFTKHPTYPYAPVNISDLIPNKSVDGWTVRGIMPNAMSKIAYNIMREALNTARFLKKI